MLVTNINSNFEYQEDHPELLPQIFIDTDQPMVAVNMTISNPSAGRLSTPRTGPIGSQTVSYFGLAERKWTVEGPPNSVNQILQDLEYQPVPDFNADFEIIVSIDDGEEIQEGIVDATGVVIDDAPKVKEKKINHQPTSEIFTNEIFSPYTIVQLKDGRIASESSSYSVKIFDPTSGECLLTLSEHTNNVFCIIELQDGRLASGSMDGTIKIWDSTTSERLISLQHGGSINSIAELPHAYLASGSSDKTIKIWNSANGDLIRTIAAHDDDITGLALLSNGRLASCSEDLSIKIWDIDQGECVKTIALAHGQPIQNIIELHDGSIASASSDKTIKVWDIYSGLCMHTLSEHDQGVYSLAQLSQGQLVSGSFDATIKIWDIQTETCLKTISDHSQVVTSITEFSDGQLASCSFDNTIRIRPLTLEPIIADQQIVPDQQFSLSTNGTFISPDQQTLTYSLEPSHSIFPPDYLSIDSETGEITGTIPADLDTTQVVPLRLVATDIQGKSAGAEFQLGRVEIKLNAITAGIQTYPEIYPLSDNRFLAAWVSVNKIVGQVFDSNFVPQAFLFEITGLDTPSYIRIDELTNGNIVIVWHHFQAYRAFGVYCQIFDASGQAVKSKFLVTESGTSSHRDQPAIRALSDGNFILAWGAGGGDYRIWAKIFDPLGNTLTSTLTMETTTSGYQREPNIVKLAENKLVVIWNTTSDGGGAWGISAQFIDNQGSKSGGEFSIAAGDKGYPVGAKLTDDTFIVVWSDDVTKNIYGQILDFNGNKIGSEIQINTYTTDDQLYPRIAVFDKGQFAVVWQSKGQDNDQEGIYGQRFNSDGKKIDSEFQINTTTTGAQKTPSIFSINGSELITAWSGNGTEDSDGIFARKISFRSTLLPRVLNSIKALHIEFGKTLDFPIPVDTFSDFENLTFSATLENGDPLPGDWISFDAETKTFRFDPAETDQGEHQIKITAFDGTFTTETLFDLVVYNPDETEVFQTGFGPQVDPVVKTFPDGRQIVVWCSTTLDDSDGGIHGQIINRDGSITDLKFLINSHTTGKQSKPDIAIFPDAERFDPLFIVVWQSAEQDGDGEGIYCQMFREDGSSYRNEFLITETTAGDQINPKITLLPGNRFIVAWQQDSTDAYLRMFDKQGYPVTSEIQIKDDALKIDRINAITLVDNNFVIVWHGFNEDETEHHIYFQRFSQSGAGKIGNVIQVDADMEGIHRNPSVVALNDGGFVVVWERDGVEFFDGDEYGIVGQRFDCDGEKVGDVFRVNTFLDGAQSNPKVIAITESFITPQGDEISSGFVVTWESMDQDLDDKGIYAQVFGLDPAIESQDDGEGVIPGLDHGIQKIGPEFRVNDITISAQQNVSVTLLPGKRLQFAWQTGTPISKIATKTISIENTLNALYIDSPAEDQFIAAGKTDVFSVESSTFVSDISGASIERTVEIISSFSQLSWIQQINQTALTFSPSTNDQSMIPARVTAKINSKYLAESYFNVIAWQTGEVVVNTEKTGDQLLPQVSMLAENTRNYGVIWKKIGDRDNYYVQQFKLDGTKSGVELAVPMENILQYVGEIEMIRSPSVLAYYSFDGNTKDASGYGYDGSFSGAPLLTTDRFGAANKAYEFAGNDRILISADSGLEPETAITISAYFKAPIQQGGEHSHVIRKAAPNSAGYLLNWQQNYNELVHLKLDGSNSASIGTSHISYLDEWHHFIGTYSATTGKGRFYVDGVLKVSRDNLTYQMQHSDSTLYIGGYPGAPYTGKIDEVLIQNKFLSEAEAEKLYEYFSQKENEYIVGDKKIKFTTNNAEGHYYIYGQLYDSESNKIGPRFQINLSTVNNQNNPFAAALPGNRLIVAWQAENMPDGFDIVSRTFSVNEVIAKLNAILKDRYVGIGHRLYLEGDDLFIKPESQALSCDFSQQDDSALPAWIETQPQFCRMFGWPSETDYTIIPVKVTTQYEDSEGSYLAENIFNLVVYRTSQISVNQYKVGEQGRPAIAILPDGKQMLVWGLISQAGDVDLTTGLVAHYPFDGNAQDASGNENHGTVNGATLTQDRFGVSDRAYNFDGSSNYINCGNILGNVFASNHYSIAIWYKPNSLRSNNNNGPGFLVTKWYSSGASFDNAFIVGADGQFQTAGFGAVQGDTQLSMPPSLNDWHHLVVSLNGTIATLFFDRINAVSSSGHNNEITTEVLSIGSLSRQSADYAFNGIIDDIRIYNRALSELEVQALYYEHYHFIFGRTFQPDGSVVADEFAISPIDFVEKINPVVEVLPPVGNLETTQDSQTLMAANSAGITISIRAFEIISISASGGVYTGPGDGPYDPNGQADSLGIRNLPFMSLIGCVNGQYFLIGESYTGVFSEDTELTLLVNDYYVLDNNSGSFSCSITKEYGNTPVVVIYQKYNSTNGCYDLYGQFSLSNGIRAGSEFLIAEQAKNPSIAVFSDNRFIVVYQTDDTNSDIHAKVFDQAGSVIGDSLIISVYSGVQEKPVVAVLNDDGFVVAWHGVGSGASSGVFARVYDVDKQPLDAAFQVDDGSAVSVANVKVVLLTDGNLLFSWSGEDGLGEKNIFGKIISVGGEDVKIDFQINDQLDGDKDFSAIAVLEDNRFVVVWHAENSDGDGYAILGRIFDEAGNALGEEFIVNEFFEGDQKHPAIAALDGNRFVVSWDGKTAQDDDGIASRIMSVAEILDQAPTSTMTDIVVGVGQDYEFELDQEHSDPDDDPLFYSVDTTSDCLDLDEVSRTISCVPIVDEIGVYQLNVTARDIFGKKAISTLNFEIEKSLKQSNPEFSFVEDTPTSLPITMTTFASHLNVTLILNDTRAGVLLGNQISGSAISRFNQTSGIWQAQGNPIDVANLLTVLQFIPSDDYYHNFDLFLEADDDLDQTLDEIIPVIAVPIDDPPKIRGTITAQNVEAGTDYYLEIPEDFFVEVDDEALTIIARINNGTSNGADLPEWLYFDADELILYGESPREDVSYPIMLIAEDESGNKTRYDFNLKVVLDSAVRGLIAHYPFNGNANDVSGYDNHATVSGPTLIQDRFGFSSSAYSFNQNYITLPGNLINGLTKFTISLWVNETELTHPDGEALISFGAEARDAGVMRIIDNSYGLQNKIIFYLKNQVLAVDYPITWQGKNKHVAMVFDGNKQLVKAYIDGDFKDQLTVDIDRISFDSNYAALAKHWWSAGGASSTRFIGTIDDVTIYKIALTDAEIKCLYEISSKVPFQFHNDFFRAYFKYYQVRETYLSGLSISPNITCALTPELKLSERIAGRLSAPAFLSGTSTYSIAQGKLSLHGNTTEINGIFDRLRFYPSTNYHNNFTVSVFMNDGFFPHPDPIGVIDFRPNLAPKITARYLPAFESRTIPVLPEYFNAYDPDLDIKDSNDAIEIFANPTHGFFALAGTSEPIPSFTLGQIKNGEITFTHDGTEFRPEIDIYTFDGGNYGETIKTHTLLIPTLDPPIILNCAFEITEGDSVVITSAMLSATGEEAPDSELIFSVSFMPSSSGHFESLDLPDVELLSFSQQEIWDKKIIFVHNDSKTAPSFKITVSDGERESDEILAAILFQTRNDAVLNNYQLTINEGQSIILNSDNFSAHDSDSEDLDSNLVFYLQNITHGQFELVSAPGISITQFTQAQITSGQIKFVHDGFELAPTFSVMVSDGEPGGEFITGVVNFTNMNDIPVLTRKQITIHEGESLTLTAEHLLITDQDQGNESLYFEITNQSHCQFFNTDAIETPITTFTQADIGNAKIVLVHDDSKIAPSFFITVSDGIAESTTVAADITFVNINKAPTILNLGLTISEGQRLVISTNEIYIVDVDNSPADLIININAISNGYFENSLAAGTPILSFTMQDILDQKIKLVHDGSEYPPSFSISASDGEIVTESQTANVIFNPINDTPKFTINKLIIAEGETVTLTAENLAATDADFDDSELIFIAAEIQNGFFNLKSAPDIAITEFTQAQIISGDIQFTHDGSESPPSYKITISDGDTVSPPFSAYVEFQQKNDLPILLQNSLTITEGESIILSGSNIRATDAETSDSELIFLVREITQGHFENIDNPGIEIIEFTQADIQNGKIKFIHNGSEYAPNYKIAVFDGAKTTAFIKASIFFSNTNTPPILSMNQITVTEGSMTTLSVDDFTITDSDDSLENINFFVENIQNGFFEHSENPGFEITEFSYSDLINQKIRFVHDGSIHSPVFSFYLTDSSDNQSEAIAPQIIFNRVNDAVITDNVFTITEGASIILTPANLNAVDPDEEVEFSAIIFKVRHVNAGRFESVTAENIAITEFTGADIEAGTVLFRHDNSENPPSFEISASDGNSGDNFIAASITFVSVNNVGTLIANEFIIEEGQIMAVTPAVLFVNDPDTSAENIVYQVSETDSGFFAFIESPTIATRQFSQADIIAGRILFVHDGSENSPTAFLRIYSDDSLISATTANFTFININDAPQISQPIANIETQVGTPFSIDFFRTFSDSESTSSDLTYYLALRRENPMTVIHNNGSSLIPPWLQLDVQHKEITGIMPAIGFESFQLIARDSLGAFNTTAFSISGVAEDLTVVNAIRSAVISGILGLGLFFLNQRRKKQKRELEQHIRNHSIISHTAITLTETFLNNFLYDLFVVNGTDVLTQNGDEYLSLIRNIVLLLANNFLHFATEVNSDEKRLLLATIIKSELLANLEWRDVNEDFITKTIGFFNLCKKRKSLGEIKQRLAQYICAELVIQQFREANTKTLIQFEIEHFYKPLAVAIFKKHPEDFHPDCINFNEATGIEFANIIRDLFTNLSNAGIDIRNQTQLENEILIIKIAAQIKNQAHDPFTTRFFKRRFYNYIYPDNIKPLIPQIIATIQENQSKPKQSATNMLLSFC